MAKSHGKKATLRRKTVPALGAGVRCVARRAGILAPSPPGKKSFDPASVDRMPPFTRKIFPTGKCGRGCCGDASGSAWVLRGRSGAGPDAAGVQRDWPGCCGSAAGSVRVLRGCCGGYAGLCRAACCRLTLSPSGIGCSTSRPPGRNPHDKRVRIGHRPPGGVEGLRTYAGY